MKLGKIGEEKNSEEKKFFLKFFSLKKIFFQSAVW